MMSCRIAITSFLVLAVYATQTVAIKCVQTECDTSKGGYCCKKDESATTKACCCITTSSGFTQNCISHSATSLPLWAGVVIGLVVLGIIAGVIVGVVIVRRRRQASVPYTTQS